MANPYTADALLLPALKRRGMLPNTAETLADTDYYALANDEIQSYIVPLLMKAREEHLVYTQDLTLTAGQEAYQIPYRAAGSKVRDVLVSNSTTSGFTQLNRIEPERTGDFGATGSPSGYRFEGSNIIIMPSPTTGGTLRLKYVMMPNRLVTITAAAQIATVNTTAKTVTLVSTPATFVTGTSFDIVRAKPGFDTLEMDNVATLSAGTWTFTDALDTTIVAGDYVCLAGESPIPQIPLSLHPLLAERVVMRSLEALGDPKAQTARIAAQELEKMALTLLSPRSDGSARAVVNRYGPGFRSSWRWRF